MGIGLLMSVLVGGLAGWVASWAMKAKTGLFSNIMLGIAGAFVLSWLLARVGIYAEADLLPQFVVACAGAALLIWIGRQIKK